MTHLRSRLLVLAFTTALLLGPIGRAPVVHAASCPTGTATVVLDPGHGGADPGASNAAFGLVEKELTLRVAQQAAAVLQGQGITVALTRADNATGLGNSARGEIANACGAEVFVSIHFNSSTTAGVNDTKTFWGKKRKDLDFSRHLSGALAPALMPGTNLTNGGVGQFATGSLLQSTMPGTLAETVFLSNAEEAARLANSDGARVAQIANAIATGVSGWLAAH